MPIKPRVGLMPRAVGMRGAVRVSGQQTLASFLPTTGATYWMNPLRTVYQDAALTTVAADTESVGGVPDALGGAVVASQTLTARPTLDIDGINSQRCLLFTAASNQYLAANALATPITGTDLPFSVSAVVKIADVAARYAVFSAGNSGSANNFHTLDHSFNTNFRVLRTDNAGANKTPVGGVPNTSAHVITHIFNGTTVTVRVDGVTVINAGDLDVGALTFNIFSIGILRRNAASNPMNGRMGHLIFWPLAISAVTATQTEALMAADYAIPI